MSEGTKAVDVGAELADLKRRVEWLEMRAGPYQQPTMPMPMIPAPQGCVCPIGAEMVCKSGGCPRRGYGGVTW